jgi:pimeloyl-[acyl-carrier protein] methyl ester esterase
VRILSTSFDIIYGRAMRTLLLPGMDGTGRLLEPLARLLPPELGAVVLSYPPDQLLGYDALEQRVSVPEERFALVAESFSGPLAIRLAERYASRVSALVLAASFARSPLSPLAGLGSSVVPWLMRRRLPDLAVRWALLGMDADQKLLSDFRSAVGTVQPRVLAHRLHQILQVDVLDTFARLRIPVLYIAGKGDRIVGPSALSLLKKRSFYMESKKLDGPHFILQRKPLEAAALISAFVRKT